MSNQSKFKIQYYKYPFVLLCDCAFRTKIREVTQVLRADRVFLNQFINSRGRRDPSIAPSLPTMCTAEAGTTHRLHLPCTTYGNRSRSNPLIDRAFLA